jgi:hypothetical protein
MERPVSDTKIIHNDRSALLLAIMRHRHARTATDADNIFNDIRRMIEPPPTHTRLVLFGEDLLEHMGQYTEDGSKITMDWGPLRPGGYYEPTFTRHEKGRP